MTSSGGSWHWLVSFVRNLTRGRRADADLDANVRSYLDLLIDEKTARGLAPADARRAALVELGGLEATKERIRRVRAGAWLTEVGRDMRHAVRMARRVPAFAVAATLTLALGIGANTAVFSVVDAVMLRDLPYGDASRIVRLQNHDARGTFGLSERERLIYAAESSTFASFSAYYATAANLTGTGDAERITGAVVDANIFETLGVRPLRGRLFERGDATGGPGTVVVLSEGFWTRRFGRDEAILGQALTLNGRPRTVVGILPNAVKLPGGFTGAPIELYLPLVFSGPPNPENIHYMEAVARLAGGVSHEPAGQVMRAKAAEIRREIAALPDTYSVRLIPIDQVVLGDVRPGLIVVSAAVGLLLLVACGNLAGLLLVRFQQRHAELSLRAALGASSGRLVRQMLTESVLLAVAGGAVGTVIAAAGTRLLVTLQPELPRLDGIGLDRSVLAFTAVLSILTGLVFGTLPAMAHARRRGHLRVSADLGRGASGGVSLRARRPLIAVQVALSVALAIGAGLLARSAMALAAVPPGFDPSGVLTVRVTIPSSAYPDRASTRRFVEEALTEIRSLPGVIAAGATTHLPLVDGTGDWGLIIEGLPERDDDGRRPNADWSAVTADYFPAMGIRVIEGRAYGPGDVEGAPLVTIINERTAREYFPGHSPLGRRMRMTSTLDPVDREIVGVVADVRHDGLDTEPGRQMFLPLAQFPAGQDVGGGSRSLVIRTAGNPTLAVNAIRAKLRAMDPDVPVALVRTMNDIVASSTSVSRLYVIMFGTFSGLAVAIVSIGVYGVASYLVATRRRELAVRRALGASPGAIVRLVLREGGVPAVAGVGAGVLAAFAGSQLIDSMLFGVTSRDPITFVLVPIVVLIVTVLANLMPARAAIAESPTVGLRQ